jgi:hypothetical protein
MVREGVNKSDTFQNSWCDDVTYTACYSPASTQRLLCAVLAFMQLCQQIPVGRFVLPKFLVWQVPSLLSARLQ